jgi:predicted 3-demethylubiquinone-9 3-methyltransferase (glyoxalase superfamily)
MMTRLSCVGSRGTLLAACTLFFSAAQAAPVYEVVQIGNLPGFESGEPMACGWIRDRFGVCWQITPARMQELTDSGTRAQRRAVMDAMMAMVKFDIAELEAAFESAASKG